MPATSRRQCLQHALAGVAAVAVGSSWPQGARAERMRLRMAVGGKAGFYYLPLTLAEQLGYFQAEGLEVGITDFPGGSHALKAALDGAADVVSGAYEHCIELQSRGLPHQAFVLQGRAPQIAMGVSPRASPPLRTVADLRGRRIGVSAPGSSTNMVANYVLARAGVRPGEVRFVGVGTGLGALQAFRAGEIDAMCNIDPVMTVLETRGEIRIVADTRTHKGAVDLFGGPMPAACLYAPTDYVERHPEVCQALANAIVRALKWLQTAGPSDIIKAVPESHMLGDRGLYLASFNRVRDAMALDGLMPEAGPAKALRALASVNERIRPERIDLDKTYTNEFARKAKQKFRA
jgi:NitT/TauT family transport system substrate-binding protein